MARGFLVSIEGGEGVGKTTQAGRVVDWLNAHGQEAIATREPGGSLGAERIRELFLSQEWPDYRTEIMLTMAARMDHNREIIEPHLRKGRWVVTDRFTDSMRAYQGKNPAAVRFMLSLLQLCQCPVPDHTIYLRMGVEKALARIAEKKGKNRYDNYDLAFHKQIADRFDYLAERNPKRMTVLRADDPIPTVTSKIIMTLSNAVFPLEFNNG